MMCSSAASWSSYVNSGKFSLKHTKNSAAVKSYISIQIRIPGLLTKPDPSFTVTCSILLQWPPCPSSEIQVRLQSRRMTRQLWSQPLDSVMEVVIAALKSSLTNWSVGDSSLGYNYSSRIDQSTKASHLEPVDTAAEILKHSISSYFQGRANLLPKAPESTKRYLYL